MCTFIAKTYLLTIFIFDVVVTVSAREPQTDSQLQGFIFIYIFKCGFIVVGNKAKLPIANQELQGYTRKYAYNL